MHIQLDGRCSLSQIIDDLACVLSRVLSVNGKDVKSGKPKVVCRAVTVATLQHFTVEVPLDAHVRIRVGLDPALIVSALGLHKLRGSV